MVSTRFIFHENMRLLKGTADAQVSPRAALERMLLALGALAEATTLNVAIMQDVPLS